MLSLIEYGEAEFSIGDAKFSLHFLTWGPVDWLEAAIHGLKNFRPFVFYGWCEPGYVFCTVTENFCYNILADEGKILETHYVNLTQLDFCKMLYEDVSKDIFAWAYFEYYGDEFEGDEYRELHLSTERQIQSLLAELDALIKERGKSNL